MSSHSAHSDSRSSSFLADLASFIPAEINRASTADGEEYDAMMARSLEARIKKERSSGDPITPRPSGNRRLTEQLQDDQALSITRRLFDSPQGEDSEAEIEASESGGYMNWANWMSAAQVQKAFNDLHANNEGLEQKVNRLEVANQSLTTQLCVMNQQLEEMKSLMVVAGRKLVKTAKQ
ncbi:hypothetical protein H0H81_010638 [Sphagnurus paluster]|uniref:Uncharacterized protein n=1 Tax=Sphagnurus paluster TaxID=117069 RepID=A0A9P7KIH8_9AGAR|nr:hypothetical protein H0H81_010638 [Sphagnurus paluster]